MAISPVQRSLLHLREQGYKVEITERWNPFARVRQDMFGFIDALAIRNGETLAVQITTASNMSARRKKILLHENLPAVLCAGWKVVVHGWRKNSQNKWVLREDVISQPHLFETTENH